MQAKHYPDYKLMLAERISSTSLRRGGSLYSARWASKVFQGTKLPLTIWFLAIYLIIQVKTWLSPQALKQKRGTPYSPMD
jgi:hypothetical protein